MIHPRLGRLTLTDGRWHGFAALPLFAARGSALERNDPPPPGTVEVRIDAHDGSPISPQQEAAIAGLLDREAAILAAVWAELTPEFPSSDLQTHVRCFEVEVSRTHLGGVAWLAFSIESDAFSEHGFQVGYHPTGGTFWGDWEALNGLEAHEMDGLMDTPMLASWQRSFPDCEPIGHELVSAFRDRWVRFHSLPEMQRYPGDEDEYATLLARHNTVLGSLTHAGETLTLLTTGYSAVAEPTREDHWLTLDPQGLPWRSVAMHERADDWGRPTFWHVYARQHCWLPGGFDAIVRRIADGSEPNVLIAPLDCRWLLHPYDGGMDVILESAAARDALKASFPDWLSPRHDGM